MKEFIEMAADAAKIARSKHNGEELSFFAKKVGSDKSFLLRNDSKEKRKNFKEQTQMAALVVTKSQRT